MLSWPDFWFGKERDTLFEQNVVKCIKWGESELFCSQMFQFSPFFVSGVNMTAGAVWRLSFKESYKDEASRDNRSWWGNFWTEFKLSTSSTLYIYYIVLRLWPRSTDSVRSNTHHTKSYWPNLLYWLLTFKKINRRWDGICTLYNFNIVMVPGTYYNTRSCPG